MTSWRRCLTAKVGTSEKPCLEQGLFCINHRSLCSRAQRQVETRVRKTGNGRERKRFLWCLSSDSGKAERITSCDDLCLEMPLGM